MAALSPRVSALIPVLSFCSLACDQQGGTAALVLGDARSVLLVEASRWTALDLDSARTLKLVSDDLPHTYTALAYHETLAELGLSAGELTQTEHGGPVPPAFRADTLEIDQRRSTGWRRLESIPSELSSKQLVELSPCIQYVVTNAALPNSVDLNVTTLARLDASTALLGLSDGRFFRVRQAGVELIAMPGPPVPHRVARLDADGQLWVLAFGVGVYRGRLEQGLAPLADRGIMSSARSMAVSAVPGAVDTLVLTSSMGLERFDGTQWRMIRAPDRAIDPHGEAQVIEIGPSRFLATSPNPTELLEVDATDQVTPIELMTVGGDADAVTALALSPELGPLAATFNGRVYARSGAGWTELPVPSQAINTIYALIPLSGRGVLAGGRRSTFTQWYSGFGDCGFVGTTLGRNTRGLVALGPDVVAAVDGDAGENQVNVAYLHVP